MMQTPAAPRWTTPALADQRGHNAWSQVLARGIAIARGPWRFMANTISTDA
jgi:hypothetical protein